MRLNGVPTTTPAYAAGSLSGDCYGLESLRKTHPHWQPVLDDERIDLQRALAVEELEQLLVLLCKQIFWSVLTACGAWYASSYWQTVCLGLPATWHIAQCCGNRLCQKNSELRTSLSG